MPNDKFESMSFNHTGGVLQGAASKENINCIQPSSDRNIRRCIVGYDILFVVYLFNAGI